MCVADGYQIYRYEGDNYVLDIQVIRAALKAHRRFTTTKGATVKNLTPTTHYLRFLLPDAPAVTASSSVNWSDASTLINLLEFRAAKIVDARARGGEASVDASSDQRVSRAVTDAFVAVEIGKMIRKLPLEGYDRVVLEKLLRLVSGGSSIRNLEQ